MLLKTKQNGSFNSPSLEIYQYSDQSNQDRLASPHVFSFNIGAQLDWESEK